MQRVISVLTANVICALVQIGCGIEGFVRLHLAFTFLTFYLFAIEDKYLIQICVDPWLCSTKMSITNKYFCAVLYFLIVCTFLKAVVSFPIFYPSFSTKSSYNLSRQLDIVDGFYNRQNRTRPAKCLKSDSIVYVSTVFRHGTRYPSLKDVKFSRSFLEKLKKANLDEQLYLRLNDTLNKFPDNNDKDISLSGIVENVHLGYRFGKKYSKLFSSANEKEVEFFVTSKPRTFDSFRGFLEGFQNGSGYRFGPTPQVRDDLLRFFDYCDKYIDDVEKNESALIEAKLYMDMKLDELTYLIESNTHTKNLSVNTNEVDSLLDVAGCEDAIFNTRNWLEIMSDDVLEMLNYAADIEDYWKKGPGFAISYEQSCILISEMFKTMDTIVAGDRSKKGDYYFSHAETLYPILGLLGTFIDHPPLYHNNSELHKNRAFKSTRINPFASNVAFVLHECSDEIFIELLFKEFPMTWSMCGNSICPYKQVRSYLAKYIDGCNFDKLCEDGIPAKNVEL